jgi:hypothetical protein
MKERFSWCYFFKRYKKRSLIVETGPVKYWLYVMFFKTSPDLINQSDVKQPNVFTFKHIKWA